MIKRLRLKKIKKRIAYVSLDASEITGIRYACKGASCVKLKYFFIKKTAGLMACSHEKFHIL